MMPAQVECRSEIAYAERPVALIWEGKRLLVSEVLLSSRIPEGMRFRVRTEDEQVFELVYDQARDTWLVWQV
jgi:hypothetical protein